MIYSLILAHLLVVAFCEPTIYFKEEFLDESWKSRWTESTYKGGDQGKWDWSAGKYFLDADKDKGIKTTQDAKFYGMSTNFDAFSNEGKTLVIQFQVKHEQNIDCGGGYVKLFGSGVDGAKFHGDTPYHIMFGPDICGSSTKKVHVIFTNKGKNHLIKKEIGCKDDEQSHLYTLIVKPDNTYEVLIDNKKEESGSLEEDWDILAPKKIKDPEAKKPEDWDDNPKIDDPTDTKPEDWEKPKTIPDPKAKKPDDWDAEMDGEWEPPMIDNPEHKGEWKAKQIDNPKYKGEWIHPEIDNPEYAPDDSLYRYADIAGIGFDLWQVKSGTIFDNVLITDDPAYAKTFGEETWRPLADEEKKQKDKADEEERKRMDEEEKKRKEEEEKKKAEEDAKKAAGGGDADKDPSEADKDKDDKSKDEEEPKEEL